MCITAVVMLLGGIVCGFGRLRSVVVCTGRERWAVLLVGLVGEDGGGRGLAGSPSVPAVILLDLSRMEVCRRWRGSNGARLRRAILEVEVLERGQTNVTVEALGRARVVSAVGVLCRSHGGVDGRRAQRAPSSKRGASTGRTVSKSASSPGLAMRTMEVASTIPRQLDLAWRSFNSQTNRVPPSTHRDTIAACT